MKTKSLIRKIKALLSAKKREQLAKYESLLSVLRKLKKKQAALSAKLESEEDKEKRRDIEHKLKVIEAQRKKGLRLKRDLEKLRDE